MAYKENPYKFLSPFIRLFVSFWPDSWSSVLECLYVCGQPDKVRNHPIRSIRRGGYCRMWVVVIGESDQTTICVHEMASIVSVSSGGLKIFPIR